MKNTHKLLGFLLNLSKESRLLNDKLSAKAGDAVVEGSGTKAVETPKTPQELATELKTTQATFKAETKDYAPTDPEVAKRLIALNGKQGEIDALLEDQSIGEDESEKAETFNTEMTDFLKTLSDSVRADMKAGLEEREASLGKLAEVKAAQADFMLTSLKAKPGEMYTAAEAQIIAGLDGVEAEYKARIDEVGTQLEDLPAGELGTFKEMLDSVPKSLGELLDSRAFDLYPKTQDLMYGQMEYAQAMTYVTQQDEKTGIFATKGKQAEKYVGELKAEIKGWSTKLPDPAKVTETLQKYESQITLARVVDVIAGEKLDADQAKILSDILKVSDPKELTVEKIEAFFAKNLKHFDSGSHKLDEKAQKLSSFLMTFAEKAGVQAVIEGGADGQPYERLNEKRLEPLVKLAKEIIKTGHPLQKVPQVARELSNITEFAGYGNGAGVKAAIQGWKTSNPGKYTEFTKAGGTLNVLLATKRMIVMAGNPDDAAASFDEKNVAFAVNASTAGGNTKADRYARLSFGMANSNLNVLTTATPTIATPAATQRITDDAEALKAAEELKAAKETFKKEIGDLLGEADKAITSIGALESAGITTAKGKVEVGKAELNDLLKGFLGADGKLDLDALDKDGLEALVTALETPMENLRVATDELNAAVEAAQKAKEAITTRVTLTEMEEGREYTDIYGKIYKKEGATYTYDGSKIKADVPCEDPLKTLAVLTGRETPGKDVAENIMTKEMLGFNFEGKEVVTSYNATSKEFVISVGDINDRSYPEVKFTYDLAEAKITNVATGNITKYTDGATTGQKLALKDKGFTVDNIADSLTDAADKQIMEWIEAGQYKEALRGDAGKPGLLDRGTGALVKPDYLDELIYCFEKSNLGKSDGVNVEAGLYKDSVLPALADGFNADEYKRAKDYLGTPEAVLSVVLDAKYKYDLSVIKADIEATTDEAVIETFVSRLNGSKEWQDEIISGNRIIINKVVEHLLKNGGSIPTYILKKVNSFADFIAMAASISDLDDAGVKEKLAEMLNAVAKEKGLPAGLTQATLDSLCKETFGNDWTNQVGNGELIALHDAIDTSTPIKLMEKLVSLQDADEDAYLKALFSRVDIAALDATSITTYAGAHEDDVVAFIARLKDFAKESPVAAKLFAVLTIDNPAGLDEAGQIVEFAEMLKTVFDVSKDLEIRAALSEKLKGLTDPVLKGKIAGAAGKGSTEADFDKVIKTVDAEVDYQRAVKGEDSFDKVSFIDTNVPATDPRYIFMDAYFGQKVHAAPGVVSTNDEFLKLARAGVEFGPAQLETYMGEAVKNYNSSPNTAALDNLIKVGTDCGFLGYVEDTIRSGFSGQEHLMKVALSKLDVSEDKRNQLLQEAYVHMDTHTVAEAEQIVVIEAMYKAGIHEFNDNGTIYQIEEGNKTKLLALSKSADPLVKIQALELLFQFEAQSCSDNTLGVCEKSELVDEIFGYLDAKPTLDDNDYAIMEKALIGGALGVEAGDINPNMKPKYAAMVYSLYEKDNGKYKEALRTLPEEYFDATATSPALLGQAKDAWVKVNAEHVIATNDTSDAAKYIDAVISLSATSIVEKSHFEKAASLVKKDTEAAGKKGADVLDALSGTGLLKGAAIDVYMSADVAELGFDRTLGSALGLAKLAAVGGGVSTATLDGLVARVSDPAHVNYHSELLNLATMVSYLNDDVAHTLVNKVITDKCPLSGGEAKVFKAFVVKGINSDLTKQLTQKLLVDSRKSHLQAIVEPSADMALAPTQSVNPSAVVATRARDLRDDMYDVYAPQSPTEKQQIQELLGIY